MTFRVAQMSRDHISGVVALQRACFPSPFPEELLWQSQHIAHHLQLFPAGQFVALAEGMVVASASSTRISEENWNSHLNWQETVGGPFLKTLDPLGSTLYGLDISVHPDFRGKGVGRRLYHHRFDLVRGLNLKRFGTACRIPGFTEFRRSQREATADDYAKLVAEGLLVDRTMTPLLKYGLSFLAVIHHYMEDQESGDAAALLSWVP